MESHNRFALTLASIMAVLIAVDTAVLIATGERTVVTDDTKASTPAAVAMNLAIAAAFGAGAIVLLREKAIFARAGRALRVFRMIGIVSIAALAAGMGILHSIELLAGLDSGPIYNISGLIAMLTLLGMSISGIALGLMSLRRNHLGLGGRILALIIPVVLATVAISFLASDIASPVFTTLTMMFGFGAIGVGAREPATTAHV